VHVADGWLVASCSLRCRKTRAQRLGDRRVVLFAPDLLLRRAIQTDQMIWRDPAFFRVKFAKLDGFENRFVVNDDGRISERLLARQIEFDHEHQRVYEATSILHVENELESVVGTSRATLSELKIKC
jgi:hypothetical protein